MDVRSLTLHIAEADLNTLATKALPPDSPLEDVRIQVRAEGICVKGVYPLLVNVSFESWWAIGVVGGKATANMTKLKAFGMPAMVFKSAVLKTLNEMASREYWFEVRGDDVYLDLEYFLSRYACPTRLNLRSVVCGDGVVIVEAGT
jgi:hypothetical protein